MKCQEVMMYMQRQLDGDLAPNEEDELHAHLMHCLDCAEMFERLQALSDELSQLPKVMPPFSLVDAIMPQLLQLDKQSETPKVDNVVAFAPMLTRTETDEEPKRAGLGRLKEQFSWKFASGVVAAGLIIGFFAFNMQHPMLDNADGIMKITSKSNSKSAPENPSAAASGMNQALENDAIANKKEAATSNQTLPNDQTSDSFAKGTATPADSSVGSGNMPQTTTDAQLEKPGVLIAPSGGNDPLARQTSPSTTAPDKLKDGDTKIDPNSEEITPAAGLTEPNSSKESNTDSPSRKTNPQSTLVPTNGNQGILSQTVPPADTLLKSTSGLYVATVESDHVVIRTSSTQEIVFASTHVWQADDQIRLLEWSKDDKLFYEVTSKGTLQTILIDVNEKTEANK